ncbi:hypothetical protein [Sorangium cellulosum]|uniref:hypothetical protein n=1 Tax=Sorangium cellulosum TaxID=56 RepID=UPI0011DCC4A0|nr:hypothetical protein [Sorangium cellulosum]
MSRLVLLGVFVAIGVTTSACRPAARRAQPEAGVAHAAPRPSAAPREQVGLCPPIQRARVATFNEEQRPRDKRWLLPEMVESPPREPVQEDSEVPLDEASARARGATSSDDPVWILGDGVPPCRMTPGQYLLQRESWGPQIVRVVRVLEGVCPEQGRSARSVVFQQTESPERCLLHKKETLTQRAPPEGLIPQKRCDPPECRYMEAVSGGELPGGGGSAVLEITATWLHPTEEHECSWTHDDFYGIFVQARKDLPFTKIPKVDGLFGVLVDDRGLRAVIGDALWIMTFVPIAPSGQPEEPLEVTAHVAHHDEKTWNSLAPYCGP